MAGALKVNRNLTEIALGVCEFSWSRVFFSREMFCAIFGLRECHMFGSSNVFDNLAISPFVSEF